MTLGPELAIIVPTFKEAKNVAELVERLRTALIDVRFEIIIVDDNSPDGTADTARNLGQIDARVRCIQRIGRRGLSSAVIEGMLATSAPLVAVIDGDLQHDETVLPKMLTELQNESLDVIVGSRYVAGGGTGDWDADGVLQSKLATRIAKFMTKVDLGDPMSGFFMLRTKVLRDHADKLSGVGYKILLDILATPKKPLKVKEVPYEFRARKQGESKRDFKVLLEYLELLLSKSIGRYVPVKFIMFSMVGTLGVIVHMAVLSLLFKTAGLTFAAAQIVATVVAMSANFFVNNVFTYFDRRLRGWKLLPGWISFCAASSVGALANVGISVFMFQSYAMIWYVSALAGIIVGSAWNYAVTALYTWKS